MPVLELWHERGYKIALQRDQLPQFDDAEISRTFPGVEMIHFRDYLGYAEAVNFLVQDVMKVDTHAEWFVTGGDDVLPDPNHSAEEIARECSEHFGGTFGICQPTGDRFAGGSIDRIAGSPWMGRECCLRINQGKGPLWPEYTHMFVDEELQNVAIKYGVFWQRPDLIHLHRHFQRVSDDINSLAQVCDPPPHLIKVNTTEHWHQSKKIFEKRKREGFPGSEPL